jgi:hypothetical protein
LLEGGSEFTVAVAVPAVVPPIWQAAMKPSTLRALAPTSRAEPFKKLLRLKKAPKSTSVPMKDLLENESTRVAGTEFLARGNVYSVPGLKSAQKKPFVKRVQCFPIQLRVL